MSETPGWTPEDSQAMAGSYNSDRREAMNKWRELNEDAVNRGAATELPAVDVPGWSNDDYDFAIHKEHELKQEKAGLESRQKSINEGDNNERWNSPTDVGELAHINDELTELQKNLERARRWASTLQLARERGVEIPEKFSRTESCIYHENALAEQLRNIENIQLGIMEFHGADANQDADAVREAMLKFPRVGDTGFSELKIDWDALKQTTRRIADATEKERVRAVFEKSPTDWVYEAPIERYRDCVEINSILLPARQRMATALESELNELKQKVGFTEPHPAQPDAS